MTDILLIGNLILLQDMLRDALNQEDDFNVVGVALDSKEAISLCETKRPDLILMDISTENSSTGIMQIGNIKKKYPEIKIIIMTNILDVTLIYQSQKSNIDSLVYTNIGKESLNKVIRTTMHGYSTYPNIKSNETAQKNILAKLTNKELELLITYSKLLDREQVAKVMDISQRTLNSHIASIYDKTGFDNLNKLVIYCVSNGFLTPQFENAYVKFVYPPLYIHC